MKCRGFEPRPCLVSILLSDEARTRAPRWVSAAALPILARSSTSKSNRNARRKRQRLRGRIWGFALVVAAAAAGVLVYGFVSGNLHPDFRPVDAVAPVGSAGGSYQVEVRNGSGASGVARRVTEYLRESGYDVVEVGNYSDFEQTLSRVIDRGGNLESAERLARVLGLEPERVTQDIRPEALLDASVVIGKDYPGILPFTKAE